MHQTPISIRMNALILLSINVPNRKKHEAAEDENQIAKRHQSIVILRPPRYVKLDNTDSVWLFSLTMRNFIKICEVVYAQMKI